MVCSLCSVAHGPQAGCPRLQQAALSLNLFAVPAFLTDPLNRFVWVNREFAQLVGDPIRDCVPLNMRFVDAAITGPYRDKFPRAQQQVAQCLPNLFREVEAGRLALGTLRLVEGMLALDDDLRRAAYKSETAWNGTLVIKTDGGKMLMVREQVVSVADTYGRDSGFHVSLWRPEEEKFPALEVEWPPVSSQLTPRQLQVACWYASGLNSRAVAAKAGITVKTARDHLEEVYSRLDVHSRAELTALLVRKGLA